MKTTTRVSESGRISIPAEMRKALGMEPGGKIVVQLVDTQDAREIRIFTPNEGLRRAQEIARRLLPPREDGKLWSDALIEWRREEYQRELREFEELQQRRKDKDT